MEHGDSSSIYEQIVDFKYIGDSFSSFSSDEETPNEGIWNLVELVVTLVQIVAAIFLFTLTKDEENPKREALWWIIGYTCASIATLPPLCMRLWDCSDQRTGKFEKWLAVFFLFWIVIFFWCFLVEISSGLDDTPQYFWLWMALLAFSCIRYVLPKLKPAVRCFVWPLKATLKQFVEFLEGMSLIPFRCREMGLCSCCGDE